MSVLNQSKVNNREIKAKLFRLEIISTLIPKFESIFYCLTIMVLLLVAFSKILTNLIIFAFLKILFKSLTNISKVLLMTLFGLLI